jgi:FAD/FMN-containing dehydrogenase
MRVKNLVEAAALCTADDLRRNGMEGKIALPGDAAHTAGRQIFNAAVQFQPAVFVFCENRHDVQAAVRAARSNGLSLSVRGGGHDWAGRALRHEGVVIDLSRMRQISVDVEKKLATVKGGATSADLIAAAASFGLAAVTAAVGSVGMIGLTLGGGYGPLSPKFGMAIDNILGAEIVLADGQLVTANDDENAELFWALRGGGGNFGVVTSIRVRLHPLEKVLAGIVMFPWSEAESALRRYAEFVMSSPDELTTIPGLCSGPDGALAVAIAVIWCGERTQGETVVAQLQRIGKPTLIQIAEMTCLEMLAMFEGNFVKGRHYVAETRSLSTLTPEVIKTFIAFMERRTSPYSAIAWHHSHGAPTRVPNGATAFGIRDEHFMIDLVAAWDSDSQESGSVHRQWVRDLSQAVASMALPGGYPNMLGPGAHDQIPYAYGSNLARLQSAKKKFDPDGVFTSATPLPLE